MRVLVLTNHFADFAGSEVVALEVAQWFRAKGDAVTLGANYIGEPIQSCAKGIKLLSAPEKITISDYDLIWCQHDLLAQLPLAAFCRAAVRAKLPLFALVSLSPYEPFEYVDARLAHALSARVIVNSEETRSEVVRRSDAKIAAADVQVFHNGAPPIFWAERTRDVAIRPLESIVMISNHPPPELIEALAMLARANLKTRHIGIGGDWRLVCPADIAGANAIITIGKSVPYAIAQRKPVYMYDHFGGDGWLTRENLAHSLAHNFSGRPARRRLTPDEIVREILGGHVNAAEEALRLGEASDLRLLSLDYHLSALRQSVVGRVRDRQPALSLCLHLIRREFRVHLKKSRAQHRARKRDFFHTIRR